eukprot:2895381-Amphidinium_carterae.2
MEDRVPAKWRPEAACMQRLPVSFSLLVHKQMSSPVKRSAVRKVMSSTILGACGRDGYWQGSLLRTVK